MSLLGNIVLTYLKIISMKKLNYLWMMLFAMVMSVGLVACDEDDENINAPQELFGTWNMYGETVTFNANGTVVWTDSYGESETASYSYSGDGVITIYYGGEYSDVWKVLSLTSTKLVIEDSEGYTMELTKGSSENPDEGDGSGSDSGDAELSGDYDMSAPSTLEGVADLYPGVSGKYTVFNTESGYSFIEMMGDGHYLIVKASAYYYMMKKAPGKSGHVRGITMTRQTSGESISDESLVFGGFTVVDTDTYMLEGFGTLQVDQRDENGDIVAFTLTDNNGLSVDLNVGKGEPIDDQTENGGRLCRMWNLIGERCRIVLSGSLVYDAEYAVEANEVNVFENMFDLDWREEEVFDVDNDATVRVFFSSNGTYLMFFRDGTMEMSNWSWLDENNDKIVAYDDYDVSDVTVGELKFSADKMSITVENTEDGISQEFIELCRAAY